VLGGLSRVRAIWLNDAHIFCAPEQVGGEVTDALALIGAAHRALGVPAARLRLSLRGPGSNYAGSDEQWRAAETWLRQALRGSRFEEAPGEAAFYGPKIDVLVADPAGREVAIATVQVDFAQPDNFKLSYVDSDGTGRRPVMVHRSIIGSLERLFAHLLEVHQGAFPAWYAPTQVAVLPVGPDQLAQARAFATSCINAGLRSELHSEGTLGARIRAARKVPVTALIGPREATTDTVTLRWRRPASNSATSAVQQHSAPDVTVPTPDALTSLLTTCAVPH
jgi:threonyl-tRNA synthetase